MGTDEGQPSLRRVSARDRAARFARWRLENIAAGLLAGSVLCCFLGPVLFLYGLATGHFDVVLAALGLTVVGVAAFVVGPAVVLEMIITRGKPSCRE